MSFQPQYGHEEAEIARVSERSELDDRLQEAHRQKAWIEELTVTKGWGIIVAFVEEQSQRRLNEVMLTPAASTAEKAAELNFTRGEYAGMKLVVEHVKALLENANEIITHFRSQEDGR